MPTDPLNAERIAGRDVVVSMSGGKDSTAAALHLRELGIPYRMVFADTGWEHADTYAHLDLLERELGPIQRLRADIPILPGYEGEIGELEAMLGRPSAMVRLCIWKGCFPGQDTRWCTSSLKVEPWAMHIEHAEETVNVVGIRRGESQARAEAAEWEVMGAVKLRNYSGVRMVRTKGVPLDPDAPGRTIDMSHVEQWRPLVDWSVEDVVRIHARHAMPMNPLYRLGATRVGCWPCIYARKSDIRLMDEVDPVRVKVIARLEQIVGQRAKARRAVRENRRVLSPPAWFQLRDRVSFMRIAAEFPHLMTDTLTGFPGQRKAKGSNPADGDTCVPIGQVIEWSRTARGGRQVELFGPPSRDWACSRYGYCETRPSEGEE